MAEIIPTGNGASESTDAVSCGSSVFGDEASSLVFDHLSRIVSATSNGG